MPAEYLMGCRLPVWVQYIAMDRHVLARMRAAPFVHVCWDNSYEIVRGVIVVYTRGGSFDRCIYGVCSAISLCMRTCAQIDGTVLLCSIPPSDMAVYFSYCLRGNLEP